MADPVAWVMIEPGWRVLDSAGEEIGRVKEVTGDENVDIFDGLAIRQGILDKDKYVPSEYVGAIVEGEVRLSLTRAQVEALERFQEPPVEEQIIPEKSSWMQRLLSRSTPRKR